MAREPVVPCPLCGYHAPGADCPHCGRAPAEPSLRGPLRGPLTGLVAGALALPRGLGFLVRTRGLKRWLLPPLAGTGLAMFLALWAAASWLSRRLDEVAGGEYEVRDTWEWLAGLEGWGWLKGAWNVLVASYEWIVNLSLALVASNALQLVGWFLIGSLVVWYCFSIVYEALAGPFLDEVQGRLEARWFGSDPRSRLERPTDIPAERCARLSWLAGGAAGAALLVAFFVDAVPWWSVPLVAALAVGAAIARDRRYARWLGWVAQVEGRATWASLQASILTGVLLVLALPLYFVPLVGYFLFAFVTGFATALGLLDIPLGRRGWPFRMRVRFLARNLPALVAFGVTAGFLLSIPVIGPVLMVPSASLGGLWLICRLDKSAFRPSGG